MPPHPGRGRPDLDRLPGPTAERRCTTRTGRRGQRLCTASASTKAHRRTHPVPRCWEIRPEPVADRPVNRAPGRRAAVNAYRCDTWWIQALHIPRTLRARRDQRDRRTVAQRGASAEPTTRPAAGRAAPPGCVDQEDDCSRVCTTQRCLPVQVPGELRSSTPSSRAQPSPSRVHVPPR